MVMHYTHDRRKVHVSTIILRLVRIHLDKAATIDDAGTIHYRSYKTKKEGTLTYEQQEEMFEDMYGSIKQRWQVSAAHQEYAANVRREARRKRVTHSYLRHNYANSGNWDK